MKRVLVYQISNNTTNSKIFNQSGTISIPSSSVINISSNITTNISSNPFNSMFQRLNNIEPCNSCRGVK